MERKVVRYISACALVKREVEIAGKAVNAESACKELLRTWNDIVNQVAVLLDREV